VNPKTLLLCALFVAAATGASAAPVLRSEVTVNKPIVTVGDLFDDAGLLAEKALFRAPAPGTAGTVSLDAVKQAARLVGLKEYESEGVLRVRVARAATMIDGPVLTGLVVNDLASRGIVTDKITVEARFDTPNPSFNAEAVADPVQLTSLRYTPGNGSFVARFTIAGTDKPIELSGRIELMIEAPHLIATQGAGTILRPEHIEMRLVPLRHAEAAGIPALDQLVGKQLTRQSRGGLMLRASDVTEPLVVERNALVTVVLNAGPMTLTVKGQALNAAAAGETVQVLNSVSRKILIGTALPSGAVAVTNTINVAGL
jgi:flagellar basal body P-ring formation protein FlgA